jgi:hypothetical protein
MPTEAYALCPISSVHRTVTEKCYISDCGCSELRRQLEYKSEMYGTKVDR